ncbi:FUSC family protein [Streptomyces sp. NPDC004065]|uniref:FUSC family protein n=1 Tax=Streptomyces sp. NPDC004065 TaxID=3364689 RepID=UPI00384FE60A
MKTRHKAVAAAAAAPARGAVALALPLLVGVWTGQVIPAVIAGIGALWGVGQDGPDPYRLRVRRLGCMGLAAATGLLAGELALRSGHPAAVTVCLVVAAALAGAVGLRGRLWSVSGMHLLLGVTIGGGIPVPGPWWQAPLALLAGVGLVVVLSAAPWPWRRHHIERTAVGAVYRAASEALSAAGTPAAAAARRRLTDALDHAHRVMGRHLGRRGRPDTGLGALLGAFHTAVRLGEVTSALVWEGRPLPRSVTDVPLAMAARLLPAASGAPRTNTAPAAPGTPGAPAASVTRSASDASGTRSASGTRGAPGAASQALGAPGAHGAPGTPLTPGGASGVPDRDGLLALADAGSPGLRALARLCATSDVAGDHEPAPPLPERRWHGRAAHVRYTVLLAACVLAAQLCAVLLHGPRGYWLPMTVAFVYKPDFGPVLTRALHRCAGTVAGVAAIGAVALLTTDTYALIGVVAAFGALMAVGVRHHYGVATTGLTAVVFVLLGMLGDHRPLYAERILDTALAAAIVLVAHFALWPDSAAGRATAQTEAAVAAALRYRDLGPGAAPAERHALRRAAYHRLAEARRAAAHARAEPGRPGRRLPDWEEAVRVAERLCDAVSARNVTAAGTAPMRPAPRTALLHAVGE